MNYGYSVKRSYLDIPLSYTRSSQTVTVTVAAAADLTATLTANSYPNKAAADSMTNPKSSFLTTEDIWVGGDLWGQNPIPGLPAVSLPDRTVNIYVDSVLKGTTTTWGLLGHWSYGVGKLAPGTHSILCVYPGES